jgi:hypothetical protein
VPWAALCTGLADGSIEQYPSDAKHATLAMVKAQEAEAENKILALLSEYGWSNLDVMGVKLLDHPFKSKDPDMLRCYKGAMERDGGIIVYSDPIQDR